MPTGRASREPAPSRAARLRGRGILHDDESPRRRRRCRLADPSGEDSPDARVRADPDGERPRGARAHPARGDRSARHRLADARPRWPRAVPEAARA